MAEVKLIRIDYRLIHGQVITSWLKKSQADTIVVVNDELAADTFMADIYKMAAPPNTDVSILAMDGFISEWQAGQWGNKKLLILFKDVQTALTAQQKGFPMSELQVGGLGSGTGKVPIVKSVSFDETDAALLKTISEGGAQVYIHVLPTEQRLELDKALERYQKGKGGR